MELEDCLIVIIAVIMLYLILSMVFNWDAPITYGTILGGTVLNGLVPANSVVSESGMSESDVFGGGDPQKIEKTKERPDNLEPIKIDPYTTSKKINRNKQYDEYDDNSLLKELDPDMIKSFDNIVIDGNNFIHRYHEYTSIGKQFEIKERLAYIKKSVKLMVKHFPDKNLYFVFKDPENEHQERELLAELSEDTVKKAHKKFFNAIAAEHPKVRFVVASGDAKYRDDYAAIWLADTLPDDTILLSRDRYRDVAEMASAKLRFNTYGKRASAINKIINKPFNFVTKGAVKAALVGYSFDKKKNSGFYDRNINRKSAASDTVYIFKI